MCKPRSLLVLAVLSFLLSPLTAATAEPLVSPRSVHGQSDLQPIEAVRTTPYYNFARAVGHMESDAGVSLCTAFRIARDLFMTNDHCVAMKPCPHVRFRLGFEQAMAAQNQLLFTCAEVVTRSLELDYAVYRVQFAGAMANPPPGTHALTPNDYPVATLWRGDLPADAALIAAGHPAGNPKEISDSSKCALTTNTPEDIDHRQTVQHLCDTDEGSSGTPLMDRTSGAVLALHWGGREAFNMAVPMPLIVTDLQAELPQEDFAHLTLAP